MASELDYQQYIQQLEQMRQASEAALLQAQAERQQMEQQLQELIGRVTAAEQVGSSSAGQQQLDQLMALMARQAENTNALQAAVLKARTDKDDPGTSSDQPIPEFSATDARVLAQHLKLPDIPDFHGHRNGTLLPFLTAAEQRFRYLATMTKEKKVPDIHRIMYMVSRFPINSLVRNWWNNQAHVKPVHNWTYDEFVAALKTQYLQPHEGLLLRMKYKAIVDAGLNRDTKATNVENFTNAVNDAANMCVPPVDNATRIVDYYKVMPRSIQRAILLDFAQDKGEWHSWKYHELTTFCTTYASKSYTASDIAITASRSSTTNRSTAEPMQVDAVAFNKPKGKKPSWHGKGNTPPERKQWPPTVSPWPELTDEDRAYLTKNNGCTYCRRVKVFHDRTNCPKKAEAAAKRAAQQTPGK